jgi:hypothetical protein
MISFTLTKMVTERSYVSRNPLHAQPKRSSIPSIISITLLSIIILFPLAFMRAYDPTVNRSVKCLKVKGHITRESLMNENAISRSGPFTFDSDSIHSWNVALVKISTTTE